MSELLLRFAAREDDRRPAIVDLHGAHSYSEIVARAKNLASALRARATRPGEAARVALLAPPGADFVAGFYGALLAGRCVVVLSPLHPLPETRYFCEDAAVGAVLVAHEHAGLAAPLAGAFDVAALEPLLEGSGAEPAATLAAAVHADAPALQLYTSGTTGKPKGAVITHANLSVQQRLVGAAWGFREDDVLLHALPLHHMHGLAIALLTALGRGATTRTMSFEARALWNAMGEATVFMGVPSMYHRLFAAFDAATDDERSRWTEAARHLRLATSGSAALPVGLAERWRALTGKIPLERFGMTEIGVGISNALDGERFPGCVGQPLDTVETRIVGDDGADAEVGELWIRGPSVFAGYHGKEQETAKSFVADPTGGAPWFRTGDTVTRERSLATAPFKILGRTSVDILKSGGYKLSALEIEEIFREHPGVAEVAVVGVADEAWGERVVACVIRRSGESCDGDTLRAFARERLAPYKVPKEIHFMEELPKNALGKVVKPELVRQLTAP